MTPARAEREFRLVDPESGRLLSEHRLTESEVLSLRSETGDTNPVYLGVGTLERMAITEVHEHLLAVLREVLQNGWDAAAGDDATVRLTWEDSATQPRTAELVFLAIRIEAECPRCRLAVAVGGLRDAVRCPECRTDIALGHDFAHVMLANLIDEGTEPGRKAWQSTTVGPASTRVRAELRRALPRCENDACGRELAAKTIEHAWRAGEKAVTCPACRHATPLVSRSDLASFVHADARATMSEERPAPRLSGGGGVCVFCQECGDVVYLEAFTQRVECRSCEEEIRIDRAAWERAIAHPGVRELYLLLERVPAARPDLPREPPAPARTPLRRSWLGLRAGLGVPSFLVVWATAWPAFGVEDTLGALGSKALMLVVLAAVLLRWAVDVLMFVRGTSLEFGAKHFSVPPIAPLSFFPRRIPYADLEGSRVRRLKNRIAVSLRGGEEIVIPDAFGWNLLRITLELRRHVPSLEG